MIYPEYDIGDVIDLRGKIIRKHTDPDKNGLHMYEIEIHPYWDPVYIRGEMLLKTRRGK